MTKSNIKVGDRVEEPRHGRGTVLAIVGEDAWVRTEAKDYPLTFDIKKLKLVPKPRTGALCTRNSQPDWWGSQPDWWGGQPRVPGTVLWEVDAVELTPEVRERLKDLL